MSGEVVKLFGETGGREMAPNVDVTIPPAPRETLPVLKLASKRMIDISSSHITRRDMEILSQPRSQLPRAVPHAYGAIMFVAGVGGESPGEEIATLKQRGHSNALCEIYRQACCDGECMVINFDEAGEIVPGLSVFDW